MSHIRQEREGITIELEDGSEAVLYVIEQTVLTGITYYLVTDAAEGDGDVMLMRDVSEPESPDAVLEFVEDETELQAVGAVFEELLYDE